MLAHNAAHYIAYQSGAVLTDKFGAVVGDQPSGGTDEDTRAVRRDECGTVVTDEAGAV